MSETHTGPAVQRLVNAIQEDIGEAVDHLQRGLEKMRALESQAKGVNGLATTLKAKGNEVEQAIAVLSEEAETVARKMLGEAKRSVKQTVDTEQEARAIAAREPEAVTP